MKLFFISTIIFFAFSCVKNDGPRVITPEDGGSEEPTEAIVAETKEFEEFTTNVAELSGLCFNAAKSGLLAVGDQGGIYEINFNGSTIKNFSYNGKGDLEGIAINPVNGDIYIVDESAMTLNLLSKDGASLSLIKKITISGQQDAGKGLEGLTYGRDTLYAVNQEVPTTLVKYCLSTGSEVHSVLDFASFLSDIFYDTSDNTLWISDSKAQKIYHTTLNGILLATQKVPVPKAEAIAVDRAKGIAWVGSDDGGLNSKLFKIKLEI